MVSSHPGKTPAQRRVLDQIGCGNYSPIMAKATRDALLKAGLIEAMGARILPGRFPVHIQEFQMPLAIHMAWCLSCEDEAEPITPSPAS